ncbi:hypothetical protein QFZ72_004560 [Bacillus sp. V2I10]|nr:hypothetical protein [Bacillus sp. V2I10]
MKVIFVFHIIGLALELYKVRMGSWAYPEEGIRKVFGVPLYSGFMYASVASYMCQAWRRMDLRISSCPASWIVVILGAAIYFTDADVEGLVEMLLPLCGTLMGLSFLYVGYLIIFQKKVEREAIAVNMFLAFAVLALLGDGMEKANKFTDDAIDAIEEENNGSTAEKILRENITDLAQFDLTNWTTTELKKPNRIPESRIMKIDITQSIDKDFQFADKEEEMTEIGTEVFSNKLQYDDYGNPKKVKLEGGWLKYDEKYYQYKVDWFTVIVTLAITAFTLLTIAIKLAKNYRENNESRYKHNLSCITSRTSSGTSLTLISPPRKSSQFVISFNSSGLLTLI